MSKPSPSSLETAALEHVWFHVATRESLTSPGGKRQFRRGVLDPHGLTVTSYGPPASHHLRWLASANSLLDIPEDVVEVSAGTQLQVWDLS